MLYMVLCLITLEGVSHSFHFMVEQPPGKHCSSTEFVATVSQWQSVGTLNLSPSISKPHFSLAASLPQMHLIRCQILRWTPLEIKLAAEKSFIKKNNNYNNHHDTIMIPGL